MNLALADAVAARHRARTPLCGDETVIFKPQQQQNQLLRHQPNCVWRIVSVNQNHRPASDPIENNGKKPIVQKRIK